MDDIGSSEYVVNHEGIRRRRRSMRAAQLRSYCTGDGFRLQISFGVLGIVRSLENLPEQATLMIAFVPRPAGRRTARPGLVGAPVGSQIGQVHVVIAVGQKVSRIGANRSRLVRLK